MWFTYSRKRPLKAIGYISDQQGIYNRYEREEAWNDHLNRTKQFILKVAENRKKGNVAVLGSGWLLDVPLAELAEMFEKVYLIDIVQPKQIKHKIRQFKNVEAVEADITGGAVARVFYLAVKHRIEKIPCGLCDLIPTAVQYLETSKKIILDFKQNFDFCVSVNLLNQLDTLLIDYLEKFNLFSDYELLSFREKIQEWHLNLLPKGKSCLITDCEELIYNKNDELEERKSLIYASLPESKNIDHWTWQFDSQMTYRKDKKIAFEVVAMEI